MPRQPDFILAFLLQIAHALLAHEDIWLDPSSQCSRNADLAKDVLLLRSVDDIKQCIAIHSPPAYSAIFKWTQRQCHLINFRKMNSDVCVQYRLLMRYSGVCIDCEFRRPYSLSTSKCRDWQHHGPYARAASNCPDHRPAELFPVGRWDRQSRLKLVGRLVCRRRLFLESAYLVDPHWWARDLAYFETPDFSKRPATENQPLCLGL